MAVTETVLNEFTGGSVRLCLLQLESPFDDVFSILLSRALWRKVVAL
jgi:hypothetical protein